MMTTFVFLSDNTPNKPTFCFDNNTAVDTRQSSPFQFGFNSNANNSSFLCSKSDSHTLPSLGTEASMQKNRVEAAETAHKTETIHNHVTCDGA